MNLSRTESEPSLKRFKVSSDGDDDAKRTSPPTTFVTWNANGLVTRCRYNQPELQQLLRGTGVPDVICMQEVRLKATSATKRGLPLPSEYMPFVKDVLESAVFQDYHKFWSLADTRYAGTLTLMHKRLSIPSEDFAAYTMPSALSLLMKKFNVTRSDVGLPNHPMRRCDDDSSRKKQKGASSTQKQASINTFFSRKSSQPSNGSTNTSTNNKHLLTPNHHPEGRFQFFCFPDFDLIQTYVPNNGTNEDSFQRRRDWDKDMKEFLEHRRIILEKTNHVNRPLLWCGDMNVAKDYRDGTHWEERCDKSVDKNATITIKSTVYEWWKDETQCFVASQGKKLDVSRALDDRGMPSFTANERRRFAEILIVADLSDVWRELRPNDDEESNNPRIPSHDNKYKSKWDRPLWTWRGHLGKSGNPFSSKYQGKGQRLDYFLLSPSTLTQKVVEKCEILGYGEMREGLFCGSDHCASILVLRSPLQGTQCDA